jgi:hypothetical protein
MLSATKTWLEWIGMRRGWKCPQYDLLHYPSICMEGLRKTTKNFSQDSLRLYRGSNRAEKKSQTLPLKPACLPAEFLFRSHLLQTSAV